MEKEELIEIAKEARKLSYSPYSHFAVGAAVLCKDGSVFVGANVENSSYPLCMCAERNAIYNAMMNGKNTDDFVSFALVADTEDPCSPCGACRQVLSELYPPDMQQMKTVLLAIDPTLEIVTVDHEKMPEIV